MDSDDGRRFPLPADTAAFSESIARLVSPSLDTQLGCDGRHGRSSFSAFICQLI
jgi:hypothetical protein